MPKAASSKLLVQEVLPVLYINPEDNAADSSRPYQGRMLASVDLRGMHEIASHLASPKGPSVEERPPGFSVVTQRVQVPHVVEEHRA